MNPAPRNKAFLAACLVMAIAVLTCVAVWRWHVHGRARSLALVKEAHASSAPRSPTQVRADGRLTSYPNATAVVGTERGGTLTTFTVAERATVKRGQIVAELDASEQRAALGEAYAHVREANVQVGFLQTQIKKSRKLVESGAVPRDELDKMQHALDAARAQRTVAGATAARLSASKAKAKVRAPFDGVVLERYAEQGETLPPGAKLLTIADLSRLRVEAEVDEFDASRVAVGAAAIISAEGQPGSWKGKVEEVPNAITRRHLKPDDPTRPTDTRVLLVKIALSETIPLRLGQRVEVSIEQH